MTGNIEGVPAGEVRVPPRYGEPARPGLVPGLLLFLTLAAVAAVLFMFNPSQNGFYPLCLFHRTTGLLCPGCGGLRAVHQLLHGHLAAAFRFNALFVSSLPVLGWYGVRVLAAWLKNQPSPAIRPAWLWTALVLLVVFGIVRNLSFAQALWLAP